jgi:hypothetical protein
MAYLIFVLVTIVLLVGFFVLSDYETRRGTRVLAQQRDQLDMSVTQIEFVLANVDIAEFLREEFKIIAERIAHDVAHISLTAVRAVERVLTRFVRRLRMEHKVDTGPRENAREFVKTLSDFKDQLKESPPEIPDIL